MEAKRGSARFEVRSCSVLLLSLAAQQLPLRPPACKVLFLQLQSRRPARPPAETPTSTGWTKKKPTNFVLALRWYRLARLLLLSKYAPPVLSPTFSTASCCPARSHRYAAAAPSLLSARQPWLPKPPAAKAIYLRVVGDSEERSTGRGLYSDQAGANVAERRPPPGRRERRAASDQLESAPSCSVEGKVEASAGVGGGFLRQRLTNALGGLAQLVGMAEGVETS